MISLELESHSTFSGGGRTTWTWVLWTSKKDDARSLGRGDTRCAAIWDAIRAKYNCWRGRHEKTSWRYNGGPLQITCSRCDKKFEVI